MKQFLKTTLAALIGSFIALFVIGLFFFAIIGSLASFSDSSATTVPDSAILKIKLSQPIGEQGMDSGFDLSEFLPVEASSGNQLGILNAIQAIDYAATDPAIKFIYIDADNAYLSMSIAEELRRALERFRTSGKPIIAYGENYTQTGYYIASVADKVYSYPLAFNQIIGISANLTFLKDFLNMIGVDVQLIRHGKYKSAGEMFVNNTISEANRQQNQELVNSLWATISHDICKSRGIKLTDFNNAVNNLKLTTPEEMKKANLIDEIFTYPEFVKQSCILFEVEDEKDLKAISLGKYAKARIKPNIKAKDKIAIIYANGDIMPGDGEGVTSDKYSSIISKVRKDSTIKAVVFRVSSPGGSAGAAEIIRQELLLLKADKPFIVSYGDYAASGGYWISADGDKIFTNRTTLTGSIGVFSMIPSFGKITKEKLRINKVSINTHKHSDMFSLMRPLNTVEIGAMQKSVETVYDTFLDIVSKGRDMSVEQVNNIAQGRVWTGSEANDIELTDEIGGILEALNYAQISADLEDYRLVEYPVVKTGIEMIMENIGSTSATVETISDPEKLVEKAHLVIRESKGIFARLPYIYEFN